MTRRETRGAVCVSSCGGRFAIRWWMPGIVAAMAAALSAAGSAPTDDDGRTARTETAQVFFLEEVALPAQESGTLVEIRVSESDEVTGNQLLALVDDRRPALARQAAELERDAAAARAADDIDIRFAVASHEVALSELQKDLAINQKSPGAVPDTEIQIKRLSEHRAKLQIEKSRLDQRVALLTADVHGAAVAAADETMRRCRIEGVFAGEVIDVLKRKGEWVGAGEPVVRVARMDRLRVDGHIDAARHDARDLNGRTVAVTVPLARGRSAEFQGRIVLVNPQVQAGNKYRVRAEVENRKEGGEWLLRPGMPAVMTVQLQP